MHPKIMQPNLRILRLSRVNLKISPTLRLGLTYTLLCRNVCVQLKTKIHPSMKINIFDLIFLILTILKRAETNWKQLTITFFGIDTLHQNYFAFNALKS